MKQQERLRSKKRLLKGQTVPNENTTVGLRLPTVMRV